MKTLKKVNAYILVICLSMMIIPLSIDAKSNTPYRFVGFCDIDDATNGAPERGIFGMHAACQATFGKTARMCTTEEYILSPNGGSEAPITQAAWIQPTIVEQIIQPGAYLKRIDISGYEFDLSATNGWSDNCIQWSEAGIYRGAAIDGDTLQVRSDICSNIIQVTCCDVSK